MRENSVKEVAIVLHLIGRERRRERERGATFVDEWQKPIIKKPIQSRINIIFAYSRSIE